ncbi:hypothetical protein DVG78_26305 [Runella aurantiaca]|uniref:Uncharacterized protein n=1 Tax=Runella aurantiaca TaxID=2282308 RepID=A0A369HZQ3_9BACT|nr:hypothetical protein DVG78_26305 [Runella aurantiaca]
MVPFAFAGIFNCKTKARPKTQLLHRKIRSLVGILVNTFQSNNYENQTISLLGVENTSDKNQMPKKKGTSFLVTHFFGKWFSTA